MPKITITTEIHAPIERCFDLASSIDLHFSHTACMAFLILDKIVLKSVKKRFLFERSEFEDFQDLSSILSLRNQTSLDFLVTFVSRQK